MKLSCTYKDVDYCIEVVEEALPRALDATESVSRELSKPESGQALSDAYAVAADAWEEANCFGHASFYRTRSRFWERQGETQAERLVRFAKHRTSPSKLKHEKEVEGLLERARQRIDLAFATQALPPEEDMDRYGIEHAALVKWKSEYYKREMNVVPIVGEHCRND